MTFDQWAKGHDFFKSDTKEAFNPIWCLLIDRGGFTAAETAEMLDSIVSAMKGEYGE